MSPIKRFCTCLLLAIVCGGLLWPAASRAGEDTWTTGGLQGYEVRSIALDPQQPAQLYAFAREALLSSLDGGGEWAPARWSLSGVPDPGQFQIDPLTPDIFYAALNGRLSRSTDRGATWQELAPGLLSDVRWFQLDQANPNVIWAFTGSDTLRSPDGGQTWASAGLPVRGLATGFVQSPDGAATYLAVERQGMYRSNDSGKTWQSLSLGPDVTQNSYLFDLALDRSDSSTVYLSSDRGPWRSDDSGASWRPMELPADDWWWARLATAGSNVILLGNNQIAISDNGGARWQVVQEPRFGGEVRQMEVDPLASNVIYLLTNTGLWKSQDSGANWAGEDVRPANLEFLAVHPGQPDRLVANSRNGAQRSEDAGRSWQPLGGVAESTQLDVLVWASSDPNIAYASRGRGLLRSRDSGQTWDETPLPDTTPVQALRISPTDPNSLYVLSDGRALVSNDGGSAWGVLPLPTDVYVRDLALSSQDANVLFASDRGVVYLSQDAGQSWTVQGDRLPTVSRILVDPLDQQRLLALASGNLLVSRDSGQTWQPGAGLPDRGRLQAVEFDARNPSLVFAHDDQRVYASLSGGDAWYAIGEPIPGGVAQLVATGQDPRSLLARTNSGALWRYSFRNAPVTPSPTTTQTPTITPTPSRTPTPMPTATWTPTARPRVTVQPAATPVDLDPPQPRASGSSGSLLPWIVGAALLAGIAAGVVLFLRRKGEPKPAPSGPPLPAQPQGLVCSQGHANPANSKFCMKCGEKLA